jgi:hypothetical protein
MYDKKLIQIDDKKHNIFVIFHNKPINTLVMYW